MAEHAPKPNDDLLPFLDDCRLVGLFGAHTGRISNGRLIRLEMELRKQIGSSTGAKAETIDELCSELYRGLAAIAPISLAHLQRWDVQKRKFRDSVFGYISILLLSVVVFAACWHFTAWDTEARLIVGQARSFDFEKKLNSERSLYKWLGTSSTEISTKSDSERAYSDWIEASGHLAEFERSRQEYVRIAQALTTIDAKYPAFQSTRNTLSNGICSITSSFMCPEVGNAYTEGDRLQGNTVPAPGENAVNQGAGPAPDEASLSLTAPVTRDTDALLKELGLDLTKSMRLHYPNPEQCQKIFDVLLQDMKAKLLDSGADLQKALFEWEVKRGPWFITHLLCARKGEWSYTGYKFTQPSFSKLSEVENLLQEASSWVLPALYGALGAALYTLRLLLDPHYPNPPLYRFLIRTIAGSFAGLAVVRFVTPDVASAFGLTWLVSFGHLALAFLAGFAVEVLLKRLADWIMGIGIKIENAPKNEQTPPG